jgi:hypothetical protein
MGEFSDVGRKLNHAGSISILPKMEQEKGEQKSNRDTNTFRIARKSLKAKGVPKSNRDSKRILLCH